MKTIKRVLIILVLIFIIFGIYKLSLKEFKKTYKINNYNIKEHFHIENEHVYDFTITKGKEKYLYNLNINMKKKKKVISSIKTYKSNNLICIVPGYKKNIEKRIYCNLDNNQVSNDYLLKADNQDFKIILSKSKVNIYVESDIKTSYKKIKVYKKNLDESIYYIWNYKGIYIIEKDNIRYKKILDYDLYDNVVSAVVNNYYVLFENTSVNGIENIYYYDITKDKLRIFKLRKKLSKNSYINGVVDNLIYVTDPKKKREYTIDIKKEKIKSVDNDSTSYVIYKNGSKKELSKSDYFMNKQIFSNDTTEKKYILDETKIYKINNKHKILLLELDGIVEWKVINDTIVILKEDTLYEYNDKYGLRKIVEYNELKYNYKNIYKIEKK